MYREIKFRGKSIYNGEWVYGYYTTARLPILGTMGHFINKDGVHAIEVSPETIGQYTGLNDINNTHVFEGDIVKDYNGIIRTVFAVPGGFAVEANPQSFGWGYQKGLSPIEGLSDAQNASWFQTGCEVIGNIYDNLELVRVMKYE